MTESREEIIRKAFFYFLNKGFRACSLKDLEQATGLTRGAFYYYFRNKEEILKECLQRYMAVLEDFSEEEFGEIGSLKAYIDTVVREKEKQAVRMQELFGAFIIEELYFQLVLEVENIFPDYRHKLNKLVRNRLNRWEETILKAKRRGEICEDLDTSVLARNLMSVSMSMVNIELYSADLKYAFSDMRMQFEQYYVLIRKKPEQN